MTSQVDLRKDEKTITDLKAKGQSPISLEQGEKLARELKYKKVPLYLFPS